VGWLGGVGTILPFVIALALSPWLPRDLMMGSANQSLPLLLVVGIAFSVTSIPVISRIFHDLGLSQTRFARLVLGVAVIEDILLWGVLAVATALAASDVLPREKIAMHVGAALLFFALGLTVLPRLLRWANQWRGNVLKRNAPVAYVAIVLLTYTAAAAALDVSLVFAAFLAGYALISDPDVSQASEALNRVSFAVFIPIYFAVIGYQLDLSRSVPWTMAALFVVVASVVKLASAGIGARLAGFRWRASINLAMALNARGGPGIVLASVAFDAHIISAPFYTTLVLLAIVTSQMAGAWLDFVSRSERDLLAE
jgi:Kef-type K+ transport system membrane component KefB